MSESVLNREFRQSDIQRVRNIVGKKYGNSTTIGVGYSVKEEQHKEDDIWIENEKKWTIKNGIKQNVTKLDSAKQLIKLPLFCPKCGKIMNNRNDKDFYPIHGMCFTCVAIMETEIKRQGKWEEYEKQIQNRELTKQVEDFKIFIEDKLQESNTIFTENGHVENWDGQLNREKVNEYIKDVDEFLQNQLK